MSQENTVLVINSPKGTLPNNAPGTNGAEDLMKYARYFEAMAGGMAPGTNQVDVHRGTTDAAPVAASAIITCAAVQSGDTVTVNGQALTATQQNARGTITPTTSGIDVDDTVTINGVAFTAKNLHAKGTVTFSSADAADNITVGATTFVGTTGAVTPGAATYSVDTGDNEAAASFAAQVNAHAVAGALVVATASSAVVTIRALSAGTAGNSIVLTSTDGTDTAVSGSGTLAGGAAQAAREFDISGTNDQCVTSLLGAIQTEYGTQTSALYGVITAWASSSTVVTVRAVAAGTGGNAITLVSSDAQLAVSGSGTLAGGAAIGNNQFDFGGSNAETATSLAYALTNSSTAIVKDHVSGSASGAECTVSARQKGTCGNAITIASSGSRLAITGSLTRLAGGVGGNSTSVRQFKR
jgi:hypothetical protein